MKRFLWSLLLVVGFLPGVCRADMAKLHYTPAEFGVVGDGKTDDTAAWQKCLDTVPSFHSVRIPPSMHCVITAPLVVYDKDAVRLVCDGQPDTVGLGNGCAEFIWKGPAGCKAMFVVNFARLITFEGLTLSCDGNATPPAAGILFDQFPDEARGPPKTVTNCTRCTVRRCYIAPPKVPKPVAPATVVTPGTFDGIAISLASQANCEYMTVDDCTIQTRDNSRPWGNGIHVGKSANAKGMRILNTSVSYAGRAFYFEYGSGHLDFCTGTGNIATDVQFDNFADPSTCWRSNFELTNQCGNLVNGNGAPFLWLANRWGSFKGQSAFNLHNQQTAMIANKVACANDNPNPAPTAFAPYKNVAFQLWRAANLWTNCAKMQMNDAFFGADFIGPLEIGRDF